MIREPGTRDKGFNFLVRKYQQRLYWHIRRLIIDHDDTDDVLQETFIKAWKGIQRFRSDSKLYTWLYRIATNEALSFIKRSKRQNHVPLEEGGAELARQMDTMPLLSGDEISRKLQKAVLLLPAKQRAVFNLKYFEEMKYQEMSEIFDTSVGALKASYHLAIKKIEKQLLPD